MPELSNRIDAAAAAFPGLSPEALWNVPGMPLPVILASDGLVAEKLPQNQWPRPAVTLPKPFTANQMLAVVAAVLPASVSIPYPRGIAWLAPAKTFSEAESFSHWGINE
jgi:hypothetical protein